MKAATQWFLTVFCVFLLQASALADEYQSDDETEAAEYDPVTFEDVKQFAKKVTPDFYRDPQKLELAMDDMQLSCVQLDDTIVGLEPLTYRVVPGFYDFDPYQATAFWLGTTNTLDRIDFPITEIGYDIPFPYLYFGYVMYKRYKEEERIYHVSHRMAQLRRAKAVKRCFEI